jgi:hypothetical protein
MGVCSLNEKDTGGRLAHKRAEGEVAAARHVVTTGGAAKRTKQVSNCQRIYPPLTRKSLRNPRRSRGGGAGAPGDPSLAGRSRRALLSWVKSNPNARIVDGCATELRLHAAEPRDRRGWQHTLWPAVDHRRLQTPAHDPRRHSRRARQGRHARDVRLLRLKLDAERAEYAVRRKTGLTS